ncbi:MAG: helix-turn-helix transcriptional regulator [Proteobacteria bacterium]|nr:helix-turn-helix transcriptional regulator [Pseudomonadota bacterium]
MDRHPAALARALAEPLRLRLLQRLSDGPATVSELVSLAQAGQPRVSNHLALLRRAGLVRATREGRQTCYELAGAHIAGLLRSLIVAAGLPPAAARPIPAIALARTCYDHLAGMIGVRLFEALVAHGALVATDSPGRRGSGPKVVVGLGPAAQPLFGGLDIDLEATARARRRFAFACLDWTERRPHLGGALGAALCWGFVARGWVARRPGSRALTVTAAGRRALAERFGVVLPEGGPGT